MIVDYWFIRRERLNLTELYLRDSQYWYNRGFNWRALAAVIIGVAPVVPGFIDAATTANFGGFAEPSILQRFYTYGFFFTFAVAGVVYFALTWMTQPRQVLAREAT
jgi:NCS1 family nucleobase:cation symporter-1